MATLTVGPGQQFGTISAAVAASHDGDVLQVQAGTYTNDFATINTKITLQGVGGMVRMVAVDWPGPETDGKGILVTNTDVTIDHFEFSGARNGQSNAAGIRYQGGDLTVTNSWFHDNQNGILGNAASTGSISISNSEFGFNGAGDGYSHNIYVNDLARLTIAGSFFHDAQGGNEIKSRAQETYISNTRVYDNASDASYSIDLPNGGKAVLTNNVIEQGPNSPNTNIVEIGAEGNLHAGTSLSMIGNTVINHLGRGTMLWNAAGGPATVDQTKVWGEMTLVNGGATVTNTTTLASDPGLDTSHPWSSSSTLPATPAPAPEPAPAPAPAPGVAGTPGDDQLTGQADGDNYLRGGDGADSITGGGLFNDVNGNKGPDVIVGRSSIGDLLRGGRGADSIDASQSAGDNRMNGNIGADTVAGGSGADTLRGGQGDDVVVGGSGDDWLAGDLGVNSLTGGQGADTFYAAANGGVSVVTDFDGAQGDRLQLAGGGHHLTQQGADLHVVLEGGAGGELVLQQVDLQSFQSGWIL